jgi:hypothetical protein
MEMMSKITFGEIIESIVMIVSIIVGLIFISLAALLAAPVVIVGYFGIDLITTFMDYVDEFRKDH